MSAARQHGSRPFGVTLVILGVFLLGLANVWRAVGLIRQVDLLLGLGIVPDPRLQIIVALIWAVLWLALAITLALKRPFSRAITPVVLLVYAFYQVALHGSYVEATEAILDQPAAITFYILAIVFVTWALYRAPARRYFDGETIRTEEGDQKPDTGE